MPTSRIASVASAAAGFRAQPDQLDAGDAGQGSVGGPGTGPADRVAVVADEPLDAAGHGQVVQGQGAAVPWSERHGDAITAQVTGGLATGNGSVIGHPAENRAAAPKSSKFPPVLITVGNADPLRPHSKLLFERLCAQGIEPETLIVPDDHQPATGPQVPARSRHERRSALLERLLAFLEQCSRASAARSWPSTPHGASQGPDRR